MAARSSGWLTSAKDSFSSASRVRPTMAQKASLTRTWRIVLGSTSDIAIGALSKPWRKRSSERLSAASASRASVTSLTVPRSPVGFPASSRIDRKTEANTRTRPSGSSTRCSVLAFSSGDVVISARIRLRSVGWMRSKKSPSEQTQESRSSITRRFSESV